MKVKSKSLCARFSVLHSNNLQTRHTVCTKPPLCGSLWLVEFTNSKINDDSGQMNLISICKLILLNLEDLARQWYNYSVQIGCDFFFKCCN